MIKSLQERLTALLESKPYKTLKDFKEVLGLAIFYLAFVATPLKPDLTVVAQETSLLAAPKTIAAEKSSTPAGATVGKQDSPTSIPQLSKTADARILTVSVRNQGRKQIENIELVVNGLEYAIEVNTKSMSARLQNPELSTLTSLEKGAHFFPNFKSLGTGQAVTFQVIGYFEPLIWGPNRLHLSSTATTVDYSWPVNISPVASMSLEFIDPLVTLAALILAGIGFRRVGRPADSGRASDAP